MKSAADRHEQAAFWFLRLRDGDIDADEIEAALAWLAAAPENQAAYDAVERVWSIEAAAPGIGTDAKETGVPAMAAASNVVELPTRHAFPLARIARVAATVLVLVGTAVGLKSAYFRESPAAPVRYATVVGETRSIALSDGSTIDLGAASSVAVEYSASTRHIVLTDGEALFRVAKNPARPFIVEAAGGSAQALGTVFNVHRGPEGVTVGVAEGVVQVRASVADPAPMVRLPAGTEVTYSALADLGPVRNINADRVGTWRQGVLSFIDRPLGAVVADLNRYSTRLIVIDDDSVKQMRVSGSVTTAGIAEWLRALGDTAAVELHETDRALVLRKSPKATAR